MTNDELAMTENAQLENFLQCGGDPANFQQYKHENDKCDAEVARQEYECKNLFGKMEIVKVLNG